MSINNDVIGVPPAEDWRSPTLINGWVERIDPLGGGFTAPVGFYKDPLGIVHLRGRVRSGAISVPIFVLPQSHRPPHSFSFTAAANPSGSTFGLAFVRVFANGEVVSGTTISGSASWLELQSIQFRTGDLL